MTITECSEASGVGAHALRFYERIGAIAAPARVGGRRRYAPRDVAVIRWVRRARVAEVGLADVAAIAGSGERADDARERTATLVRRLLALRAREAELARALAAARALIDDAVAELTATTGIARGSVAPGAANAAGTAQ